MITLRAPWRRSLNVSSASSNWLSGKVWVCSSLTRMRPSATRGMTCRISPVLARTPKVPEPERTLPEATQGDDRAVLQVVLVDAEKGIVRGVRSLTLSPEFTRALQGAIRAQAEAACPRDDAYNSALQAIYRRFPSTGALLELAETLTREARENAPAGSPGTLELDLRGFLCFSVERPALPRLLRATRLLIGRA
jgi:hypothetical protein